MLPMFVKEQGDEEEEINAAKMPAKSTQNVPISYLYSGNTVVIMGIFSSQQIVAECST